MRLTYALQLTRGNFLHNRPRGPSLSVVTITPTVLIMCSTVRTRMS